MIRFSEKYRVRLLRRLMKSVQFEPNTGCWLFERLNQGYGRMSVMKRFLSAHRISWMLHRGSLEDHEMVLHRCDTPACVNPDHLFVGAQSDNMQDMVRKGRHRAAGDYCRSTETERRLALRLVGGGASIKHVARTMNRDPATIRRFLRTAALQPQDQGGGR